LNYISSEKSLAARQGIFLCAPFWRAKKKEIPRFPARALYDTIKGPLIL
jgi:hypothetical protein